mgnify:CR=1 FL=1
MLCSVKEKRNLDIGLIELLGYYDIEIFSWQSIAGVTITQYPNISIKPGSGINEALIAIPQLSQPETE